MSGYAAHRQPMGNNLETHLKVPRIGTIEMRDRVTIEQLTTDTTIDTGATLSFISERIADQQSTPDKERTTFIAAEKARGIANMMIFRA